MQSNCLAFSPVIVGTIPNYKTGYNFKCHCTPRSAGKLLVECFEELQYCHLKGKALFLSEYLLVSFHADW